MSQIFEALRRSREQDRRERTPQRNAQTDSVLATMGFASERKRSRRERIGPFVLIVLVGVIAWLAWRTYADMSGQPATGQRPASSVPSTPAVSRPPDASARAVTPPSPPTQTPQKSPEATAPNVASPTNLATPRVQRTRMDSSSRSSPSRPDAFQLALYYQRAGDFEKALTQYRAILQQNELNVQAHNNLGLLYRDKGLLDEALRHFQRALLIDGRYTMARNNLGVTLLGLRRLEEAAHEFRRVLAQDPRHLDAMVNLALVEKASGRPAVAMETLLGALVIDPRSAPAHYNLAVLYEQSGDTARAVDHYRAFLEHAGPHHGVRATEVRGRLEELVKRPGG